MPRRLLSIILFCALTLIACGADTGDTRGDFSDQLDLQTQNDNGDQDSSSMDTDTMDTASDLPNQDVSDVTGDQTIDANDASDADAADTADAPPPCDEPAGAACNPIPVTPLPFVDNRDTSTAPASAWNSYSCAPDTDELGGEFVYRLELAQRSTVTISVDDMPGDGVDVDVHLLSGPDPKGCLARDNTSISRVLEAGTWWIAVDTWANSSGDILAGPYELTVSAMALTNGDCSVDPQDMRMFWDSCDSALDCYESNGEYFLRLPATGPVVKEAHLVTTADGFGVGWPTSFTDGIDNHYAISEAASGYVMTRTEPWAPAGEGGSEYGQGSTGAKLPPEAEAWYINMYWRDRPAPGTRFIVTNPANGRAVVAAGGYETGPGANTAIGGAVEEIHHYLGTTHRDSLTFGVATDQSLTLGPIECP